MIIGIDASRANRLEKTGIEWYAYHLLHAMQKIADPSDRFLLYTDTPLVELTEILLMTRRWEERLLRWPPRKLWTQGRLSLEMLFRAPDLLFIPSHVIPVIHPKRVVLTCHDIGFERRPELYPKAELTYHRWSMRYGVRAATHIIAVSEFTKHELMDVYGLPSEKITVIHHGFYGGGSVGSTDSLAADTLRFRESQPVSAREPSVSAPEQPHASSRLPIASDLTALSSKPSLLSAEENTVDPTFRYFLYVGRIEAKKNLHVIIDAFTELERAKKIPEEMQLFLVGRRGYQSESILHEAKEKGRGAIRYLPWVPSETLQQLYQHATAFLFPSLYEGFGFPLLEALSYGVPVIASHIPALREIGGDAAIFATPTVDGFASAMQAVIENPPTLVQKQQWKKHGQRFSWENAARKTLTVLHNALQ